jgi:hypothetical protein
MGESGSDTAAVEVDDAPALAAREDDAPVEGIVTLRIEQTETLQEIARIALSGEMPAQAPTRGITDAQFFDQGKIVQSALFQIVQRLGVAIELLLVEGGSLLEHGRRIG